MKRRQKNIVFISTAAVIIAAIIFIQFPTKNRMLEKCADMEYLYYWGKRPFTIEFVNQSLQKKLLAESNNSAGGGPYTNDFITCELWLKENPRMFKAKYK